MGLFISALLSIRPFHIVFISYAKLQVRHTLKKEKTSFVFYFSNNKLLSDNELNYYLKKSKNSFS